MRRFIEITLVIVLFGCGREGLEMQPYEVDSWFLAREEKIQFIVNEFEKEPCLKRVELGSMEYIRQHCESTPDLEPRIKHIQAKLKELGVVLAASHRAEDGRFNISILINRQEIAVSGGGLALVYWSALGPHARSQVECGELIPLSERGWYAQILHSEPSCVSNKSSQEDVRKAG